MRAHDSPPAPYYLHLHLHLYLHLYVCPFRCASRYGCAKMSGPCPNFCDAGQACCRRIGRLWTADAALKFGAAPCGYGSLGIKEYHTCVDAWDPLGMSAHAAPSSPSTLVRIASVMCAAQLSNRRPVETACPNGVPVSPPCGTRCVQPRQVQGIEQGRERGGV